MQLPSSSSPLYLDRYVLGTGLIGALLLNDLLDSNAWYMTLVELLPAFSLYRQAASLLLVLVPAVVYT